MYQDIPFTYEDGEVNNKEISVFALSTCGFCRRGIQFLKNNKVKFRYVYIDKMPYEEKQQLKKQLQEKFQKRVAFPFVVVNDEEALVGFIKRQWEEKILSHRIS